MRLNLIDFKEWDLGDRIFCGALSASLLVHVGIIVYLSSDHVTILQKPVKKIEVVYEEIKQKPAKEVKKEKPIEAVKEQAKKVEILSKESRDLPVIGEQVKDISKLSDHLHFSQKESPRIKTLDMTRNISIPVLQSEKISNPRYLTYNQHIRQKIKEQAYRHIDNPEFQAGEVYLTFVLASNGALVDLKVIEERTHASEFLKSAGLRSIKEANPFPPFPKELTYPELTFNVVISFEVKE